jgi:hypothetical protein
MGLFELLVGAEEAQGVGRFDQSSEKGVPALVLTCPVRSTRLLTSPSVGLVVKVTCSVASGFGRPSGFAPSATRRAAPSVDAPWVVGTAAPLDGALVAMPTPATTRIPNPIATSQDAVHKSSNRRPGSLHLAMGE